MSEEEQEQQLNCRIVDGYSSEKTYVILATHGEDRVSIRFLGVGYMPEVDGKDAEPKICMATSWKVHVEKDDRSRSDIKERSFAKFGLPDEFMYKGNRYTGILTVPFAYRDNAGKKIVEQLLEAEIARALWDAILIPSKANGAIPDCDQRTFAKWVKSHFNVQYIAEKAGQGNTRGRPECKAWWTHIPKVQQWDVDNDEDE